MQPSRRLCDNACEAKVCELGDEAARIAGINFEQDVLRLQVTVNDAVLVQESERRCELEEHRADHLDIRLVVGFRQSEDVEVHGVQ